MNYPPPAQLSRLKQAHRIIPVISTAHITREDGKFLLDAYPVRSYNLLLDSVRDGEDHIVGHLLKTDERATSGILSENLCKILRDFAALGYLWLILDVDGDIVAGLETFDW